MRPTVYETRVDFIQHHVPRVDVLDVGAAELVGTTNAEKLDRWPHHILRSIATTVVGLEQDRDQVEALRARGYDIREGDAESFDLGRKFDCIFAGEVIEHLSNPGRFLDCTRTHLADGGRLLITTPNRFNIHALRPVVLRDRVPRYTKLDAGHVFYFDIESLSSLLVRHGFEVEELGYYAAYGGEQPSLASRALLAILRNRRHSLLPGLVAVARLSRRG